MQAFVFCGRRNKGRNKHVTEHGQTPAHCGLAVLRSCGLAAKRAAIYEPSPSVANPVFMVTHRKQVTEVIFRSTPRKALPHKRCSPVMKVIFK
jgi:hypothetical protein